jgi:hypothetical protein
MKQYIEVTQDAAAIINKDTPENVIGFYTTELQTCVAIIIKASLGILMIHHSGRLAEDSLRTIMQRIGNIERVIMCVNNNDKYRQSQKHNLEVIFSQTIFENVKDITELWRFPGESVSFTRQLEHNFEEIDAAFLLSPINKDLRIRINALNYLMDSNLSVDLQYNGSLQTPCTHLSVNLEEIFFRVSSESSDLTPYQQSILIQAINSYIIWKTTSSAHVEEIDEEKSSAKP